MTFEAWMKQIDHIVGERCGLSYRDLHDIAFRDRFNDGFTPAEVADELVYDAMSEMGDFADMMDSD